MVQATVQSNARNNIVLNFFEQKTITSNQSKENLHIAGDEDQHVENQRATLVKWFAEQKATHIVNHRVIRAGKLHFKDRITLRFVLADDYVLHFALLRGLFAFAKPVDLLIDSDFSDKSFTIEFNLDQTENAVNYLDKILNWLSGEMKFKATLKQVMQWELKVRLEQDQVFKKLRAAA